MNVLVLCDGQKGVVAGYYESGACLQGSGEVFVIICVRTHTGQFIFTGHQLSQYDDILEPQLRIDPAVDVPSNLRI